MTLYKISAQFGVPVELLGFQIRLGRFPKPAGRDPETGLLLWSIADLEKLEVAR